MMNKKGDASEVLGHAIVFIALFFIGGFIGIFTLPSFTGRFFICGLIFGAAGTGLASFVFHLGGK